MFQGKFKTDATMGDGIPYKFIVVYDKFTKVVANSIKNQSVIKNITSTIWNEKIYYDNESRLTNFNHVLFLSEKLVKEKFANPALTPHQLLDEVVYKTEGNEFGIYIDDENVDFKKSLSKYKTILKEKLGKGVLGLIGIGFSFLSDRRKAKLCLLFKACDKFVNELMENWIRKDYSKGTAK